MLCNRIKQFREYNKISAEDLCKYLGISLKDYEAFEKGTATPTIDIIERLAKAYKVTVDEFYGYTPRLTLHTSEMEFNDDVEESTLKMSDLSWDEMQIILKYRESVDKETMLKDFLDHNSEN